MRSSLLGRVNAPLHHSVDTNQGWFMAGIELQTERLTLAGQSPEEALEIAYGIDPDHRGRGYATEAAAALVDLALADASVRVVRAHTFEKSNVSTRVLTRCGFRCLGEVTHPEDGLVWRWELQRDEVRTGVRRYKT